MSWGWCAAWPYPSVGGWGGLDGWICKVLDVLTETFGDPSFGGGIAQERRVMPCLSNCEPFSVPIRSSYLSCWQVGEHEQSE